MEKWEEIAKNTYRLKVFGGWIIKVIEFDGSVALAFVSDTFGVWRIGE